MIKAHRSVATLIVAAILLAWSWVGFTPQRSEANVSSEFQSTFGTEFWVHFDTNFGGLATPKIFLASILATDIKITWPDGTTYTASTTDNSITSVDAPTTFFNRGDMQIRNVGIKIESLLPIGVYLLNLQTATSDASIAYPTSALGQRYVVNYTDRTTRTPMFSVLAAEPGTTNLSIRLPDGSLVTKSLTQGQAYSHGGTGLYGAEISSSKKVVVSGSHPCANFNGGACDHVTEFLTPTSTWGREYLLASSPNTLRNDDYVIVASEPNTTIQINGVAQTISVPANEVRFRQTQTAPFVDIVTADKPISIMQEISNGSFSNGTQTVTGDPALLSATPTPQFLNDVIVATAGTQFAVNFVQVIAATSDVNGGLVKLNNQTVAGSSFTAIPGTQFSVARLPVTQGTHRIKASNGIGVA
ncbi:MAG: hypothetical protein EBS38_06520, partial [Actinobacteria bacterium]|nr:hypothetical protein [Actinomycetota bacterium]